MRPYKVYSIEQGTVIDHIPDGKALDVLKILGVHDEGILTIGMHFESGKHGKKDIVKIENKELSASESAKIALIAPTATVNIIRNGQCAQKIPLQVPERIIGVMKCPNPICVTNHERVTTKFVIVNKDPLLFTCNYCEKLTDDVVLLQ